MPFLCITDVLPTVWGCLGTNQHCLRYLPAHQGGDWNGSCSHFHWAAELRVRGCPGAGKNQQDIKIWSTYLKCVFLKYILCMQCWSPGLTMRDCCFAVLLVLFNCSLVMHKKGLPWNIYQLDSLRNQYNTFLHLTGQIHHLEIDHTTLLKDVCLVFYFWLY